ncbi:MAG: tetratricopeptide repeat protein [Candidatus Omnitrophota bacterium]
MKNSSHLISAILIFVIIFFSFGFVSEKAVVAQNKIDLIKQRIPNQWWYGGWDEKAELQSILDDQNSDKLQKAQAQFYIACQDSANRDYQNALQEFRLLIDSYPDAWLECQKAQFEIAQIYMYRLGDYPTAIAAYQKAIDNYEDSGIKAESQMMIGRAFRKQKNYEQALKEYKKVAELYPTYIPEVTESNLDIGDMIFEMIVVNGIKKEDERKDKIKEALLAYKKAYESAPLDNTEFMERSLEGVHRSLRCLDGSLVRANNFVKYQKYGSAGFDGKIGTNDDLMNPLETL